MPDDHDFPVVVRIGHAGYATSVDAAGHSLLADEPERDGGTDTGPSPYDYLLTALGTCTAMTLRMYADRKGWPLTGATVRLAHHRIHARDCEHCESETGMVAHIQRELDLEGNLTDEQRQRLEEIADRCPVHRTLTHEVQISSSPAPRSVDRESPSR
jgi:putative redox protein